MSLEVSERPIVSQHVKSIGRSLESSTWAVSTVPTITLKGTEHCYTFFSGHLADLCFNLPIRAIRYRIESRSYQFYLRIRIEIG
jgi:hypothetical protein